MSLWSWISNLWNLLNYFLNNYIDQFRVWRLISLSPTPIQRSILRKTINGWKTLKTVLRRWHPNKFTLRSDCAMIREHTIILTATFQGPQASLRMSHLERHCTSMICSGDFFQINILPCFVLMPNQCLPSSVWGEIFLHECQPWMDRWRDTLM